MKPRPLQFKSLVEVGQMIRQGKATSAGVTQDILDLIARMDGGLHSYIHLCADRALAQAATADVEIAAGIYKGPLHGVPIAVKDLCYTTYAPTRAGTTIYKDFLPTYNATVVLGSKPQGR